jgi:hypothetical protein
MHKPHLTKAHTLWEQLLAPTDIAIDATCGNGHDTLKLATLLLQGHVYSIDIQDVALRQARQLVTHPNVTFLHQSHIQLPSIRYKLVVYNLGYLPGGDKALTTTASTTLQSVKLAALQLEVGGALSITCYPRHPEGEIEENTLLSWCRGLDPAAWKVEHFTWKEKCPTVLFIIKVKS